MGGKVLRKTGRWRVVLVLALPGTLRTRENPPHSSSRPLHLPFLLLMPHSSEVFPGRTHPKHPTCPYRPFWRHSPDLYSFLPTHAVPVPHLPCLCQRSPRLAVSVGGFSQGCALPSAPARSCPGAGVAALAPAALGAARARRALCSYWPGLCVPLSANDGAGGNWRPGPAPSRDEAQTVSERLCE